MATPRRSPLVRYGTAALSVILATLIRMALDAHLGNTQPYTTYFAAIMFTAWYSGWRPSIIALISGGLLGNYLFDEPRFSLLTSGLDNQIHLCLYLVVGLVMTALSTQLQVSRQRAEAARLQLEASEVRFRTIADFTYDWEYWVGPDGNAIYVSPSSERITGHAASEFLGDAQLWLSITHADDRLAVADHQRLEHESQSPLSCEFRIVSRAGEVHWIEHMCQAVFGPQGEYLGRRANNRDVTARRHAEVAARQAQTQLLAEQQRAAAEKLASVGRLAAGVAHEVRNPLTAIKMWLFSIRESVAGQPEVGRKLAIVAEEIARLEGIVREFLEFSRPPVLHCRPESLEALLDQILEFLGPRLAQEKIRVVRRVPPDLPPILADGEQLKQVLLNLLGNAAEVMPAGGQVELAALTEPGLDGQPMVVLRIRDSGPGMTPESQQRLFDPFFSTKEHGTGLGLWISSQIMARHQGQLILESSTERGTVFAIWIPIATAANHGQDSRS